MKVIKKGVDFVFPKGLVHFQMNEVKEEKKNVIAIATFGNANPRVVALPTMLVIICIFMYI